MAEFKRKSDLEVTYTKGEAKRDPLFGECFIYNSIEDGSRLLVIEKLLNDKESVEREVNSKKKKILSKHDNLINLLDYSVEVQSNWCSTFYLVKTFYEFCDKSLKKEIVSRKGQAGSQGSFSMSELTHLLYQIISAGSFLQEKNIHHGDISPTTVMVASFSKYKLSQRINEQISPERLQLEKSVKGEAIYIAPNLYSAVKNRKIEGSQHNPYKADVFSLGLTILEAGIMKSVQSVYNKEGGIDYGILEEFLLDLERKFQENPLLYTSVRKMLEIDEEERPDFLTLKSAMPEYEVVSDYLYKLENGLIDDDEDDQEQFDDFNSEFANMDQGSYNLINDPRRNSMPETASVNGLQFQPIENRPIQITPQPQHNKVQSIPNDNNYYQTNNQNYQNTTQNYQIQDLNSPIKSETNHNSNFDNYHFYQSPEQLNHFIPEPVPKTNYVRSNAPSMPNKIENNNFFDFQPNSNQYFNKGTPSTQMSEISSNPKSSDKYSLYDNISDQASFYTNNQPIKAEKQSQSISYSNNHNYQQAVPVYKSNQTYNQTQVPSQYTETRGNYPSSYNNNVVQQQPINTVNVPRSSYSTPYYNAPTQARSSNGMNVVNKPVGQNPTIRIYEGKQYREEKEEHVERSPNGQMITKVTIRLIPI